MASPAGAPWSFRTTRLLREIHRVAGGRLAEAREAAHGIRVLLRACGRTAVLEQHHGVVAVVAVAHGSLHHGLGRYTRAEDALDGVGLEVGVEVGRVERAHAVLG